MSFHERREEKRKEKTVKIKKITAFAMLFIWFVSVSLNEAAAATLATATQTTAPTGYTTTQVQNAATTSQTLVNTQNALMSLTATTTNTLLADLSGTAKTLSSAVQASTTYMSDINYLYGTTITSAGPKSGYDVDVLNTIVAESGYTQTSYLSNQTKVASLVRALRANTTQLSKFNTKYQCVITTTGKTTDFQRDILFGIVKTSGYSQTTFLSSLTTTTSTSTLISQLSGTAKTLSSAIQASSTYMSDINYLYGTTITSAGPKSSYDVDVLNTIVTDSGYTQTSYLSNQTKSASLVRALRANTTLLNKFNTKYQCVITAAGKTTDFQRDILFGIVKSSTYSQTTFLNTLNGGTTVPTVPVSTGTLFSSTSFWNQKTVQSRTTHWNSANFAAAIVADTKLASPWIDTGPYSTPYYKVTSSTAKKPVYIVQNGVTLTYTALNAETSKGVPIPSNLAAASGTDGHVTIYDTSTDTLYEFWQMKYVNGRWQATWGGVLKNASTSKGVMPTVTNSSGGKEYWGATATGLPVVAGTVLLKELQSGVIPHALAFAMINPGNKFVPPATRSDGPSSSSNAPPEGTTFRLPANTYIDPSWSPAIRMIAVAARDYGVVLRDTAGAVKFYMEDATQYGGSGVYDPYFGGLELWDVVKQFPWSKLQAVNP